MIDEEETDDPEKHASASSFSPESNKAHVSTSSHLSLIFARLGNRGKQSRIFFLFFSFCISQKTQQGFTGSGNTSVAFSARRTAHWAATQNEAQQKRSLSVAAISERVASFGRAHSNASHWRPAVSPVSFTCWHKTHGGAGRPADPSE